MMVVTSLTAQNLRTNIPLVSRIACTPDGIPVELRKLRQWVVWQLEYSKEGRITKIPYNPVTNRRASTTNRSTWGTYEQAIEAYQSGHYSGIGFVFTADDPYTVFDLDRCIDETGYLTEFAQHIINLCDSYSEISQSGRGVHIIVRGAPPGDRTRAESLEIYTEGRYVALTGVPLPGTPMSIEYRQLELDDIYNEHLAESPKSAPAPKPTPKRSVVASSIPATSPDHQQIVKTIQARPAAAALWQGDTEKYGGDATKADLALCQILNGLTGGDAIAIDSLFRISGLMRPKWDTPHYATGQTYGEATIAKAIQTGTHGQNKCHRQRQEVRAAQVAPKPAPVPDGLEQWVEQGRALSDEWRHEVNRMKFEQARWYASGAPYGDRFQRAVELWGDRPARNIQKWSSAYEAWGDDWQHNMSMEFHQKLQTLPREIRMQAVSDWKSFKFRTLVALYEHYCGSQKNEKSSYQKVREIYGEVVFQEWAEATEICGHTHVQRAIRDLFRQLRKQANNALDVVEEEDEQDGEFLAPGNIVEDSEPESGDEEGGEISACTGVSPLHTPYCVTYTPLQQTEMSDVQVENDTTDIDTSLDLPDEPSPIERLRVWMESELRRRQEKGKPNLPPDTKENFQVDAPHLADFCCDPDSVMDVEYHDKMDASNPFYDGAEADPFYEGSDLDPDLDPGVESTDRS